MRFFRKFIGLLLLFGVAFLAGDYFNLPLWPVDWLVPTFPIEIRIDLDGVKPEFKDRILEKTHYSELDLCSSDGTLIRKLNVDEKGVARCVIREGRYSFHASVPVIDNEDWYFFVYPSDGRIALTTRKIQKTDSVIQLVLKKIRNVSDTSIDTILRLYLIDADIEAAVILSPELTEMKRNDVSTLLAIETELSGLSVTAYNSIIDNLSKAIEILNRNGIDHSLQILKVNGEIVNLESRKNAVRQARDNIIRSYVDVMKEFQSTGQLINVVEEWNQMTGNKELYTAERLLPQDLTSELQLMSVIVKDVMTMIPGEIQSSMETAVSVYEAGDLTDARSRFMRLLSYIRNLNLEDTFSEMEFKVTEYLEDIEVIVAANQAIRTDQPQKALQLYDLVTRPNAMVRERILETERFLHLRNGRESDTWAVDDPEM